MGKCFVGDVGTLLIVDCKKTITGATGILLKVRKPDETEHDWSATIYDTSKIQYTVQAGDFDQAGDYRIQSYLTLGSWVGRGHTFVLTVYSTFSIWD